MTHTSQKEIGTIMCLILLPQTIGRFNMIMDTATVTNLTLRGICQALTIFSLQKEKKKFATDTIAFVDAMLHHIEYLNKNDFAELR